MCTRSKFLAYLIFLLDYILHGEDG
jgi:hypothetical protein